MKPNLHPDAVRLIERHDMLPHPEGGFFVETFRSEQTVQTMDGRGMRSALTNILFLLDASLRDGISRLHQVSSDEVWHYLAGAPLTLTRLDPDFTHHTDRVIGPDFPTWTIPAHDWQAARTSGPWTLVGCSVGPGFDFDDFRLLKDESDLCVQLLANFPHVEPLI